MDRKEYLRNYQRKWIAKKRNDYLKNKCCAKCLSTKNLEIDHINPEEKERHISRLWSYKKEIIEKELKKCQILCFDCHLKKTIEYSKTKRNHGRTLYKYGCRCEICFKAQQDHNRQRKNRLIS